MTATIPMDFYPKLEWCRYPDDPYAQGRVITQQDHPHGEQIAPDAKPQILEATEHLLVAEQLLLSLLPDYDAHHCWESWAGVEIPRYRKDDVLDYSGLSGCLLHISGINRTLTYRIGVLRDIGAYECTRVER